MYRPALILLLIAVSGAFGRHEQYEGHQLYSIQGPQQKIAALQGYLDLLSARPSVELTAGHLTALVRLSPEEKQQWLTTFEQKGISYTMIADNLAEILRSEEAEIQARKAAAKQSRSNITYDTYYRHDEINDHLDSLAQQYPELLTVINVGLSYEGRQIKLLRVSTTRFENLRKPVIVIDAAIHAREWITIPVALYIIEQLVVNIADNNLTENIDWIIIPVANPDGYEYSHEQDRLWRKTRSRAHANSDVCPGVDANRNFDHYWGTSETSALTCSQYFEGPTPFSEPETRIIRNAIMQNINRVALYITLHSFGNTILYAWGNNGTLPSNGLNLHLTGVRIAGAIDVQALQNADRYIVGNAAAVLYNTTGTSRDWVRAVGIPLTYTLELQSYGNGLIVPPNYIEQIAVETWAGIAEGARLTLDTL